MFSVLEVAHPARVQRSARELIDRIVLGDGRAVDRRPVSAGDAADAQAFVRGLSAASRQLRFHVVIRELPPVHANLPMIALVRSLGGTFVAVPGDPTLLRAVFDLSGAKDNAPVGVDRPGTPSHFTLLPPVPVPRSTALACGSR
jgi:hypothetical protein